MRKYWLTGISRMHTWWLIFLFLSILLLLYIGIIEYGIFRHILPHHFLQTVKTQLPQCDSRKTDVQVDSQLRKREMLRALHIEVRESYTVINHYIKASYHPSYNLSVTLCTQGTHDFLHHIAVLCDRWKAPLSVAVYAPGQDFHSAIKTISYLRQCGPKCIPINVTWHMIYDSIHAPPGGVPMLPEHVVNCSNEPTMTSSYREEKNLAYPINIARNVARLNSNTHYLFVSDIELYPSLNIVPRFLKMVYNENLSPIPHIYVLPPFEMGKGFPIPNTKAELVKMIKNDQAVFFHMYTCDVCHRFPRSQQWLEVIPPDESMNVYHVTKGSIPWEPFYIGSDKEPLFDERFMWEGMKDKISHTTLLCFMDYDMYILDNAFLMHSPGIKTSSISKEDYNRRAEHLNHNNRIQEELLRDLKKKYPNRTNCQYLNME